MSSGLGTRYIFNTFCLWFSIGIIWHCRKRDGGTQRKHIVNHHRSWPLFSRFYIRIINPSIGNWRGIFIRIAKCHYQTAKPCKHKCQQNPSLKQDFTDTHTTCPRTFVLHIHGALSDILFPNYQLLTGGCCQFPEGWPAPDWSSPSTGPHWNRYLHLPFWLSINIKALNGRSVSSWGELI